MKVLEMIMGVKAAGEIWGLSPDQVKRLCRDGKVNAVRIGNTWILEKDQENPKQRERNT